MGEADHPIWEFAHSVECAVPREFAWGYWTNIANWIDPPAKFEISGPFTNGARLSTILPGQTYHSTIHNVVAGSSAAIEMELPGATLHFDWSFEDAGAKRTRIAQRVWLSGVNAEAFVAEAGEFERNLPGGMARLAAAMGKAYNFN